MGIVKNNINRIQHLTKKLSIYIIGSSASLVLLLLFYLYFQISILSITGKPNDVAVHYLPDNSRVLLKDQSQLRYNRFSAEAAITVRGEVYFEFNPNSEYRIKTRHGEIDFKGTKFHIVESNDGLNVVCYNGLATISMGNDQRQLKVGEQFIGFNNGYAICQTRNFEHPQFTRFLKEYENENIGNVFAELGCFFGIDIQFDKIVESNYSGSVKVSNYKEALDLICDAQQLNYYVNNQNQVVIRR